MPIVIRVTPDMFQLGDNADLYVNPVNLLGAPGAGLAKEFATRVPAFVEPYKQACKDKSLHIGTIQIIEEVGERWGVVNLPTKRHFYDTSDPEDIARGLEALREALRTDKYKYSAIGIPMLGCGLGQQDYATVYPMMEKYLGDLDACVFVSMAPDKTELHPTYLTIVGPTDYGTTETEQTAITWGIEKALEVWGTKWEDYTGIVSGGHAGVDAFVCGTEKDDENTLAFRKTSKVGLVVKPNIVKNSVNASLRQGNLLSEIGDDIILFKPKGHNNNRMSAMQVWIEEDHQKREAEGKPARRVAVFGEQSVIPAPEGPIIASTIDPDFTPEDVPY